MRLSQFIKNRNDILDIINFRKFNWQPELLLVQELHTEIKRNAFIKHPSLVEPVYVLLELDL
jgi:hypothetical protein